MGVWKYGCQYYTVKTNAKHTFFKIEDLAETLSDQKHMGKIDERNEGRKETVLGYEFYWFFGYFVSMFGSKCPQNPSSKLIDFFTEKMDAKKHCQRDPGRLWPSLTQQTAHPKAPLGGRGVQPNKRYPFSNTPVARGPANFLSIFSYTVYEKY